MTAIDPAVQYRLLPEKRAADDLEREVLERWREEDLFRRQLALRAGAPEFVFFEGPPTANGRPGIHHVFARTVKDLFCRYRAMSGFHVARKAGWDTHGLPVEIEVEKQLGISGKQQIEAMGVEEFNRLCRESVFKYRADWEKLSERIGYWLDYGDPYITYSNEYVESVWWALSTLFERGLLYRGHKILPYCARCGTALSSHEVAQGYEDVEDPSVYVALDVVDSGHRRLLVWTTTPWTLVSNVALAVNPELDYVELQRRGPAAEGTIILATARASAVLGDDYTDRWETVRHLRGSEMVGWRYRRPLDWLEYPDGAHEIVVGETFVSAEDGSGIVHMAPAFGADDYAAGQRHGLAFLQPVDARGQFPADLPVGGGMFVKDADPLLIEELKRRGVLWKAGTLVHAYPHCWRCGTPLLYYARTSWFVKTTAVRDQMLGRNARVDWHPDEAGTGRFGEWLKNNIDWAISRDRYWGTPLPIWVCDRDAQHVEAIGSYAALAARLGRALPDDFDPHKPYIDRYTWPCATCAGGSRQRGQMNRSAEVIDAWFDSGSMPFAQWHFPFERRDVFERSYPADFIAEGIDQTRGWFYSMLAIATGLGEALPNNGLADGTRDSAAAAAPYRAVVVNDLVLDAEGQKMSKSKGNVVDPWRVIAEHGVDAVRLFLVASSQVWVPRRFDEKMIRETAGGFFNTLRNVYSGMFAQYANFGWTPSPEDPAAEARPLIDRWVLGELARLEDTADALMARYEGTAAARAIMDFVVDDLANWYVRLNRARFYDVDSADNRAAFATLHEALVVVCRLLAPFAPFVSDWMHRELTGESVHLVPFVRPAAARWRPEAALGTGMRAVRTLVTLGRAAREEAKIKVRQPLSRMVCVVPDADPIRLQALLGLVESELNVKRVELATSADALVRLEAKPNFRALGKKFGKNTPLAAQAVAVLDSEALRAFERGEPLAVSVGNESRLLDADDLTIVRRAAGDLVVAEGSGYFAAIDPALTAALRQEGMARELISRVQQLRKRANFAVSDRIALHVSGNEETNTAVRAYQDRIAAEVLARELVVDDEIPGTHEAMETVDLDGVPVRIAITRIA